MKPKAKPRTDGVPMIATMRLDLALDMDHELVRLAGVRFGLYQRLAAWSSGSSWTRLLPVLRLQAA